MTDLLPVRGSPGSPYTRKMLALLRYRRIPYRYLQGAQEAEGLPAPKVGLIPIFYFADEAGITTGALYHYFDSKLDIYRAVLEQVQQQVYDSFEAAEASADDFLGKLQAVVVERLANLADRLHLDLAYPERRFRSIVNMSVLFNS